MTRRMFGLAAAGWTEFAFAQRALPQGSAPPGTVWLNANENPEGPPQAALDALARVARECGRYGFQHLRDLDRAIARAVDLDPESIVAGAGSTDVLNAAVAAFTSDRHPVIMPDPTFEAPAETARVLGRQAIRTPLTASYAADGKRLLAEAEKAGGGLVYVCNPNNPTASLTPELPALAANLPRHTVLLVDEAYLDFCDAPSALAAVRQGKDVVVTRTFSKIYGMAGLRIGYACGRPELIRRVRAFRNNPISLAGMRAAVAALEAGPGLVAERRARLVKTRTALCEWLRGRGLKYIEPHANFVMIDTGRDPREVGRALLAQGVAAGRPFPPLDRMLRVTIGTDAEMAKFREAFAAAMAQG